MFSNCLDTGPAHKLIDLMMCWTPCPLINTDQPISGFIHGPHTTAPIPLSLSEHHDIGLCGQQSQCDQLLMDELIMDLTSLTRFLGWFKGALCCGGAAVSGHLVSHEYRLYAKEWPHGHRRDDGRSFLCGKRGDADPTSLCRDDKHGNDRQPHRYGSN